MFRVFLSSATGAYLLACATAGEPVLLADFTKPSHGFKPNAYIEGMRLTADGLAFESKGRDPYLTSSALQGLPNDVRLLVTLRMKTEAPGPAQLFHASGHSEEDSIRFPTMPDGEWRSYAFFIPPQKAGSRFRIDPAGGKGRIVLGSLVVEPVPPLPPVELSKPKAFVISKESPVIASGDLRVAQDAKHWDRFVVGIAGQRFAQSHGTDVIITEGGESEALSGGRCDVETSDDAITVAGLSSRGGFRLSRTFRKSAVAGTLAVETTITPLRKAKLVYLPLANLFPGLGSFGSEKSQAVLPGVEYLANEPSSSEADVKGAPAERRIVDDTKLTQPLMALAHRGRALGVFWDRADHPAAVFDTPDRVFHSGASLIGLWHHGVGSMRSENGITPERPFVASPDEPIRFTFTLAGSRGDSVVPILQQFLAARPLPELPVFEGGFDAAARLLGSGWVDSAGYDDGRWRHAVWQNSFGFQPSADACAYTKWLTAHLPQCELSQRLEAASKRGRERLNPRDHFLSEISHIRRHPAAPLVFGEVSEAVEALKNRARDAIRRFDGEGLVRYHPRRGRPDYGATHFENHANGITSLSLLKILHAAAFTGDPDLITRGLALLDRLTARYANRVPRGAQTWEVPMHTPDILASAQLVQCYTLGYLLSEKAEHLEQARYWAWTGIPFVYLDPPVEGPIGVYSTIPVFGATNWVAPNWIGRPVQWCGLVYRSALEALAHAESDSEQAAFWQKLARGITLTGLQHTFPPDDSERRGLLPDFFELKSQVRAGPAINPGTLQAHLAEAYGKTPFFTRARIPGTPWIVHVPGEATHRETRADGSVEIGITGWPGNAPYHIHISGIAHAPSTLLWNDGPPQSSAHRVGASLTVQVSGNGTLVLKR